MNSLLRLVISLNCTFSPCGKVTRLAPLMLFHGLLSPAGGSFEVQMAGNRGQTTYSPGNNTSEWPDGNNYPEDYHSEPGCITQPNRKFFFFT